MLRALRSKQAASDRASLGERGNVALLELAGAEPGIQFHAAASLLHAARLVRSGALDGFEARKVCDALEDAGSSD